MAVLLFLDFDYPVSSRNAGANESAEKLRKKLKKYLTNRNESARINDVPPLRRTGRVPCKLNNVTNEKHQSSAFYGMQNDEVVHRG